jgi:hypothetical protein
VSDYIEIDSGGIWYVKNLKSYDGAKLAVILFRMTLGNSKNAITPFPTNIKRADKTLLIQIVITTNYTNYYNLCQGGSIAYENWLVMEPI